jgi:hypothetical protein
MALKSLTSVQTDNLQLDQIQASTKQATQDSRNNPTNSGTILTSVSLTAGDNSIPHKLPQKLTGWYIVRLRGASTIYDKQDSNKTASQTLALNSSAAVSVDIFVF